MTTLRQQFIRELVIRGMSPKTQYAYVRAVRDLALHPNPPRQALSGNVKLVASYQKNPPKKAAPGAKPPAGSTKMVTSTVK